jgi:Mn2+/Fe2+ NRAMP family transporter
MSARLLIVRRKALAKRCRSLILLEKTSFYVFAAALILVGFSEVINAEIPMAIGGSALILSTMLATAFITPRLIGDRIR